MFPNPYSSTHRSCMFETQSLELVVGVLSIDIYTNIILAEIVEILASYLFARLNT